MFFSVPASVTVALKVVNPVPLEVNAGWPNTPSPINVSYGASAVLFGSVNVIVGAAV